MFPFGKSDELCFQNPPNQDQQYEIQQDSISSNLGIKQIPRKPCLLSIEVKNDETRKSIELKEKERGTHKEIERRRRKGMSDLFVSLRSILPVEFIKGKRSKSDHIKHLEKNIDELKLKKEKLIRVSNYSEAASSGSSNRCLPSVTVCLCQGGIDVLINCSFGEDEIPISRVLRVLKDEGLNVVSIVSTQVNERLIFTIKSEVSDRMCDSFLLQQKLVTVLANFSL